MINVLSRSNNKKKGSVIVVVICLFVALLILFASFLKSSTSRVYTTKKLGDTMHAREFAQSLALLSFKYLKNIEIKDNGSSLRTVLSLPVKKLEDKSENITNKLNNYSKEHLKNGSDDIISLLVNKSGLNNLKWSSSWLVKKIDFQEIPTGDSKLAPFPREKKGVVRLSINVSYVLPGTKTPITEDYLFISQVSVVANILPVLSKFSLYVKDALNGESGDRFNVVDTKGSGDLNSNPAVRPWVISNGENSEVAKDKYDDIVNDSRGMIYLGGGTNSNPIILGIARGWADAGYGKYGEDFHFYKNSNAAAGYWRTIEIWESGKGLMRSDIGLCNDTSDDNLRQWQEQLGTGFGDRIKYNSMFKLYGTDGHRSPTIVLGYVESLFASIRMYKHPSGCDFLLSFGESDFPFYTTYGADASMASVEGYGAILNFFTDYLTKNGSEIGYDDYIEKYASQLWQERYNNDYAHIINNSIAYPKITDDKLKELCKQAESDIYEKVPNTDKAPYAKVFGDDLSKLEKMLDPSTLNIDGSGSSNNSKRLAYAVKASKIDGNINTFFESKNLLKTNNNKSELDLNGWLYIECDKGTEIVLDKKLNVVSHGGIIVANGDITIKGDIECSSGAHFTLLSLDKNIVIESGVKRVDASLIAGGGQVKLLGKADSDELTVNGNIVMNTLEKGEIKDGYLKRGLNLNYKNVLSAIPFMEDDTEEDRSELPLLMFDLSDNAEMLD
jgi:hypothetical protein